MSEKKKNERRNVWIFMPMSNGDYEKLNRICRKKGITRRMVGELAIKDYIKRNS